MDGTLLLEIGTNLSVQNGTQYVSIENSVEVFFKTSIGSRTRRTSGHERTQIGSRDRIHQLGGKDT